MLPKILKTTCLLQKFCVKINKNTKEEKTMPGLHFCYECWYYDAEKGKCDAKHGEKSPGDWACTDFSNKNEED